ncbi:MAG: SDR family oxidoreductase [Pseudomonadota bacterium]
MSAALITGGTAGIGADLARSLRAQGRRVIVIDRKAPERTEDWIACDLLDPAAVAEAAVRVRGMNVTRFVHNAGLIRPAPLADASHDDLAALAQLHLGAALTLMQAVLPAMEAEGFGRVVFNASRAVLGVPTRTAYSATKAGMIGMARTWALELAPKGITVNVVAPGPVRTENFWSIVPRDSDREAALAKSIPVGRLGEPEDVTRAMLFFLDDAAGFVTGQTLYVCGGASVGTVQI